MGFLTIRLIDLIDILIVTFLLYKLYNLLRGGVAINIFIGLLTVYALYWIFVKILSMELLGTILGQFISLGFIALIIVFQQEVRRFLIVLGTNNLLSKNTFTKQILPWNWQSTSGTPLNISAIVKACRQMSKNRTGAIIVIAKSSELKYYSNTGDLMDAEISQRLIESIFFKNSPLHDGAIIVVNNKIKAARCVLPVTENVELPGHLGMRHRAAIGITEQSDAIAIVVSEETGEISIVKEGQIQVNVSVDELERRLKEEFSAGK
ncbi:MAG: TIGR00159 family protein [Bacteroidetes bacterium]|nr:MAG: TIGR00159 family protein [Bacteroidota bacterium]REK08183.1 MAG: TIGR00159 family protein [Bacteroidota bacterium]REK32388.1 MAG: TIGR00159 family protein [Bacteroidota bacterium]REK47440.1 MAG: TIGR00159 family protein [Bacteroidota bacterium]